MGADFRTFAVDRNGVVLFELGSPINPRIVDGHIRYEAHGRTWTPAIIHGFRYVSGPSVHTVTCDPVVLGWGEDVTVVADLTFWGCDD